MKRVASFLCALALCCTLLPVPAGAVEVSDLTAYQKILTEHVEQYGIYEDREALSAEMYPGCSGLLHAELVDFNGDGRQELYLAYLTINSYDQTAICDEVWSGDKLIFQEQLEIWGYASDGDHNFAYKEGKVYLVHHDSTKRYAMSWEMYTVYEFTGSQFQEIGSLSDSVSGDKFASYQFTLNELGKEPLEEEWVISASENASYSPQDYRNEAVLSFLDRYGLEKMDCKIAAYVGSFGWGKSDLSLLPPETTAKSVWNELPYIGDISKCQMSYEQAKAYQKILEDIQAKYHTPLTENERSSIEIGYDYAFLFDILEDGVPLLYVNYWSEADLVWIAEVWCYDSGNAIKLLAEENIGQAGAWGPESLYLKIYKEQDGPYLFLSNNTITLDSDDGTRTTKIYKYEPGKLKVLHSLDENYGDGNLTEPGWFPYEDYGIIDWDWMYATFDGEPLTSMEQRDSIEEQLDYYDEDTVYLSGWDSGIPIPDLIGLLSQITPPAPTSSYPYAFGTLTEAQISGLAKALADCLGGEVTGVYKLAEDLYYVVVTLTDGGYGGAVVKESRTGFRVLLAQETPIEDGDLAPFAAEAVTKPNLTVDYGQIGGFTAVADYIRYLGQLLEGVDGTAPNAPAKGELTAYAEAAVSRLSGATVKAKGNRVTITGKTIETAAGTAQEARDQLSGALADSGVALNKPITILLRIEGQNINLEKPVQVTLDPTVLDTMGEAAAIQLLLGDGSHSVKLTAESLKALLGEYGKISVQLARTEEGVYTITFADKTGATLDKLPADVTFTLPAESGWATVLASYQGGSDNWGGQYDAVNGALEFSTKFSGQYEVLKNDLDISDLEDCSDEARAAVRFMVSKGYFDLTEGAFLPAGELTRYDFTAALVKMFFALDRSLETSFPDVPQEGPYYDYVASAEHGNIVKGYADGTFSGGDAITGEQVLALCARTLAERKGYVYPEDPEQYLSGPGRAETSGWAREAVALAVREGLIHPEEDFAPAAPMTRGQSAQVLYRLFMLLYETSPVAFEVRPAGAEFPVVPVIAGGAVVVLLAGGGCWFLFRRKKRTPVG